MSVPTSNLYNFVTQALENQYLVKYFYPWGEKGFKNITDNIEDVMPLTTVTDPMASNSQKGYKIILCHDQEPLDFNLYSDKQLLKQLPDFYKEWINKGIKDRNLRWNLPSNPLNHWILLHSELNSPQVIQYESTGLFKCAYWWSHAVIALDWYRFARYDNRLTDKSQPIKANFLVYARGTTGKRAYRKIFLEHLQHINSVQLGSIDPTAVVTSDSSATYTPQDFAQTRCSIVLETVYDQRIHLTEKTLRPIACGHPFMILSGPGTLAYLRKMGFNTFSPLIDESYDLETDPTKRMEMVINEMTRINNLSEKYQQYIWKECQAITSYNKNYFFSRTFQNKLVNELKENVSDLGMPAVDWKLVQKYHMMKSIEDRRAASASCS